LSVMDAAGLGFSDQSFDLVFGIQNFVSACKVPPQELLRECLRVARPGGRILLSSYAEQFWPHRLEWFRQQAAEGLLGAIDEAATGNGVIICKDGFKATTFSTNEFTALTDAMEVEAKIYLVDDASVFCEIGVQ
jgi:SAM-dependent methyltransferase